MIEDFIRRAYMVRYETALSDQWTTFVFSVAVAIFPIGGMIGSFCSGFIANRYGR